MKDLYFEENYGKLYEAMEGGETVVFDFSHHAGRIRHLFIKREIPYPLQGGPFYDLVTPYGYGGPLILYVEAGRKSELVAEFEQAFQSYCKENKVVSEFVRFHPLVENAQDFTACYEVTFYRHTIITNLAAHEDPIQQEYSSSCRRDIRHALKAGMEYRIIEKPESLALFKTLYYSTMQRNEASRYYYFDDAYFSKCLELFKENLVLVEVWYEGQVIGMSLNFTSGKILHAHLTGTLKEFHHLFPALILQYGLAVWGKANGFELVHHGGGRTNLPDDTLYLFKKKFGRQAEGEFFVGKKIWNADVYGALCEATGKRGDQAFFPAYRAEIEENSHTV
ncbi:GNAT family N-acetyltransferase [Planococcus chinensis]|uniref:Lipid II:glycine glycyltransferase n=1 Tax=Planococcus chinensis TaxID=272917 RepID=A0ABW4QEK6_9BACL